MYARRRQTRSLVFSAMLTTAFLFIFSTPTFSSPGIISPNALLPPESCISFRGLPITSGRKPDPAQVTQALYRAHVLRTEGILPIPRTLLTDFPDSNREHGETPVLIAFPKEMATELRALLHADPRKALDDPGENPFLRELLGEPFFQADQRSSETRGTFPTRDHLVKELGQAQTELRHYQDQLPKTQQEVADPTVIRNMHETEVKMGRLHLLVALRDYYEAVLSEAEQQKHIEELYVTIGSLSTALSTVKRELIIPIGRHTALIGLAGDAEFTPTRAEWLKVLDRFNLLLPGGLRYNANGNPSELNKLSRILAFMREVAKFPEDASEWDPQEKRRRLWGVMRVTQFGQNAVGDGRPWSADQVKRLQDERIISAKQAEEWNEILISGKTLEAAFEAVEAELARQKAASEYQPDMVQTEKLFQRLRSLLAVQSYVGVFEHLAAQNFPTAEHLAICRKLVVYEAQAENRWQGKDRENISLLRSITDGYVDQYVEEAKSQGVVVPPEATWKQKAHALEELEKIVAQGLERLAEEDYLQWVTLLLPKRGSKGGSGLPVDAPWWNTLLALSPRSGELLRGAVTPLRPDEVTHPRLQAVVAWSEFLGKLLTYKRPVLKSFEDPVALAKFDVEMTEAGITKPQLLAALSGFLRTEDIADQIPERPTDIIVAVVTRDALLPHIVEALSKFLEQDVETEDPALRQVSRAAVACRDLMQAKPALEKFKTIRTIRELFETFHDLDQAEAAQRGKPSQGEQGRSPAVLRAAPLVVEQYMQQRFSGKHPAIFIPPGTQQVILWLHGMGTNRSTVRTLDQAVDLTSTLGKGVHGIGISAPWHGGPNFPLGAEGMPTQETLRLVLNHIHAKVMFFKEKGLRVVVAGRSLNASLLMQYLVDYPGILDGAIAYGGVLPPGFPRGSPLDQIAVNNRNASEDEALRARNNETLSRIAMGLLGLTDWYTRLEDNPRLLDSTPTWVLYGGRDQEYQGILPAVLAAHMALRDQGVRMVPLLFDEGAHQSFNPRTAPTEEERLAPDFKINDYNGAFPAIVDITRLYLEDPQAFTWNRVREAVRLPEDLDPYHMPSHLEMRPRLR